MDAVMRGIFAFWLSHGATPTQANALTHLAWQETRGEHCISSRHGDHYLLQWNGARYAKLLRFAGTRSCPPLETQLAFANWELHHEPFNGFWSASQPAAFLRQCYALGRC